MKIIAGISKDGKKVYMGGHPHREDLIEESISLIDTKKRPYFMDTVDLGRVIGVDHFVKKEAGDTSFYMKRGSRPYETHFIMKAAPETSLVTVGICLGGEEDGDLNGEYVLFTLHEGQRAPKEPGDPSLSEKERDASIKAWAENGLSPTDEELAQAQALGLI